MEQAEFMLIQTVRNVISEVRIFINEIIQGYFKVFSQIVFERVVLTIDFVRIYLVVHWVHS